MSCMRSLAGLSVVAMVCGFLPQHALAQRRGELVEGLLRTFVESQLQRDRQKAFERQQALQQQQMLDRHGYPHVAKPPAAATTPRISVSPQVNAYRTNLRSFASQSASLADGLQKSVVSVRGVRPLMADALKLKAASAIMYEQSQKSHDLALLREEYCGLDCQWREMSFQLQQLRGLDSNTTGCIRQLDGYSDGICDLLGLEPQFDREAVFRLTVETTAHLGTLLDDIQYELYGLEGTDSLAGECRGLAEQARRLSGITSDASYDELITKYSSFVSDWRRFAAGVYRFENTHCDRSIRRIRTCNRRVFGQLWTPLSIDRAYLTHVSHQLSQEVDLLFENMTVKALVQMPAATQQAVLTTARDMFSHCQEYCACVDNNSPLNDLMTDYIEINNQWTALDGYLNPVTSKTVASSRRLISAYDAELRGILRVPARLDHARAIQLAASLEELAEHLRYDVRRYGRYYHSSSFRNQAYQSSDTFYAQAKNLHAHLQNRANLNDVQASCNGAVTTWGSVSEVITAMPKNGLTSSRYQLMHESRQEVLPVIAELATMLGV